jgi:hypothetical protein
MKGDRVEVVVDTGEAGAKTFEIEVAEVTRGGQPVRVGRFLAARVIALVEHPAEEREPSERRRRPRLHQEETLL